MSEWQPIDTARKDGSPILIPTDDDVFPVACVVWDDTPYYDGVYGWKDNEETRYNPSRWTPCPKSGS